MRKLNRTASIPPPELTAFAERHLERVRQYFSSGEAQRPPEPEFDGSLLSALLACLREWTKNKCSYCETLLDTSSIFLNHFRPEAGALRSRQVTDRRHYCWLAADWNNLFAACSACNMSKANIFPVSGPSPLEASIQELRRREKAQLLDPSFDKPEKHFRVASDGVLIPLTDRADTTISTLQLNRSELINGRRRVINTIIAHWDAAQAGIPQAFEHLLPMFSESAEHSGAARIYLRSIADFSSERIDTQSVNGSALRRLLDASRSINFGVLDNVSRDSRTPTAPRKTLQDLFDYRAFPLKALHLRNFKGIQHLDIAFPEPSEKTQWIALLGPNGVGKTSILQAIALCLLGHEAAGKIEPDARKLLVRGADGGEIRIDFWYSDAPATLRYTRGSKDFSGERTEKTRVVGYGAYRVLSKRKLPPHHLRKDRRVQSLFDYHAKLNGHHGWLDKVAPEKLQDTLETLSLLLLADDTEVRIAKGKLQIAIDGRTPPLNALSSGVQNVFLIASELLEVIYELGDSAVSSQAFVLIDELDAHLHPAWRIKIVERLRRAFPRTHFIFTTHDPLPLRSMKSNEVLILRHDAQGRIHADGAVSKIEGQVVDEMLTSNLFGLYSTYSEKVDGLFARYYSLLGMGEENLRPAQDEELADLEIQLNGMGEMGKSTRERLFFKLIDRALSQDRVARELQTWQASTLESIAAAIEAMPEYRNMLRD